MNIDVVPFWNFRIITRQIWGVCSEQEPAIKLPICISMICLRGEHTPHSCISGSDQFELEIRLILRVLFLFIWKSVNISTFCSYCWVEWWWGLRVGQRLLLESQLQPSTAMRNSCTSASTAKLPKGRAELPCEQKIFLFFILDIS